MVWLKVLLACLAVTFSTGIGYVAANKYRCRYAFYRQFQDFNARYVSELEYARKPLPVFLSEYPASGDFKKTLEEWTRRHAADSLPDFLTKEEKAECADYFAMLGRGDAAAQREYFSARRKPLEERSAASEKESKARNALYLKLGLLAGLAFVILIL